MFDELVRRGTNCSNHVGLPGCSIPDALQKRLSFVCRSRRGSLLNPLYVTEALLSPHSNQSKQFEIEMEMEIEGRKNSEESTKCSTVEINVVDDGDDKSTKNCDENDVVIFESGKNNSNEIVSSISEYTRKSTSGHSNNGLSPLRYNRRCRNGGGTRPLSGSSIASSTSSSGCSNQGIASAVNPYLASVESLADTCASSQGKEKYNFFFQHVFTDG